MNIRNLYDRLCELRKDLRKAWVHYICDKNNAYGKFLLSEQANDFYQMGNEIGRSRYLKHLSQEEGIFAPEIAHLKYPQEWLTQPVPPGLFK